MSTGQYGIYAILLRVLSNDLLNHLPSYGSLDVPKRIYKRILLNK